MFTQKMIENDREVWAKIDELKSERQKLYDERDLLSGGARGAVTRKINEIEEDLAQALGDLQMPEPYDPEVFFKTYVKPFPHEDADYSPRQEFAQMVTEFGIDYAIRHRTSLIGRGIYWDLWNHNITRRLRDVSGIENRMIALREGLQSLIEDVERKINHSLRDLGHQTVDDILITSAHLKELQGRREGWNSPRYILEHLDDRWDSIMAWIALSQ